MISIFKKEIAAFFSSLIGYITIGLFLLVTGLFNWVFPDTNLLDYGYATLDSYFTLAPWIFIFLIPAITMRSFAEEYKSGTMELLATKPLHHLEIILGKFWAAFFLVIFAVLPTLLYFWSIYQLGNPPGNVDTGATWGSYIGLLSLGATFVAIGLFASSTTDNQIVAFLIGMFLCFFFYLGFDYISGLDLFYAKVDNIIQLIGINAHYTSISRGVVDTRDLIYFGTLITAFILLAKITIEKRTW